MSHFGGWKKGKAHAAKRRVAGEMNGLERDYAAHLDLLKIAGAVAEYAFEPLKLGLGVRCYYDIDFLVQAPGGLLEAHEVKGGFWEDDARVKFRTAAELHSWLAFFAITREKGVWIVEAAWPQDRDRATIYGGAVRSAQPSGVAAVGGKRGAARQGKPPLREDL